MSTVLVTGANRGLGLELIARLAQTQPEATILLGTRSLSNGEAAVEKLQSRGIKTAHVKPFQIDVASQSSVDAAVAAIKKDYNGKLSTLYNNAALAVTTDDFQAAKDLMAVNYYGVKRMIKAFHPILTRGSHNVVVSSEMGAWATHTSPSPHKETLSQPQNEQTIDKLVERYLSALDPSNKDSQSLRSEFPEANGFFGPYAMSKAFLNSYLRYIAPTELKEHGVTLVAVCPGYCATELNGNSGPRKASTGAWSIAQGGKVPQTDAGGFFRDGKPVQYVEVPRSFDSMIQDAKVLETRLQQQGEVVA